MSEREEKIKYLQQKITIDELREMIEFLKSQCPEERESGPGFSQAEAYFWKREAEKARLKAQYCEKHHAFCPDCRDKLGEGICWRCRAQEAERKLRRLMKEEQPQIEILLDTHDLYHLRYPRRFGDRDLGIQQGERKRFNIAPSDYRERDPE